MKVLITGCAGFIGFHLARKLLSEGSKVYGVDSINDYYDINIKNDRLKILKKFDNFSFFKKDISDPSIIEVFSEEDFDNIYHLAAQAGVRYSIDFPESYTSSNLVGFANILELTRKIESRLIFASTSSVYGANENLPFSEKNFADHPIQYYAATKRSNEIMAHSYSAMYGLEMIGLRFFTVYGPFGRPDMALFKFTKNIINDKPIEVFNNGNHVRDFTYVDDIVSGIEACSSYVFACSSWDGFNPTPHNSKFNFRIFNLGNGNPVNLMDYIKVIEKELGKKAAIKYLPMQVGDVSETIADISNSSQELGFLPKTRVDIGVPNFIKWYKDYYSL